MKALLEVAIQAVEYLKEANIEKPHFIDHADKIIKESKEGHPKKIYWKKEYTGNLIGFISSLNIQISEDNILEAPLFIIEKKGSKFNLKGAEITLVSSYAKPKFRLLDTFNTEEEAQNSAQKSFELFVTKLI